MDDIKKYIDSLEKLITVLNEENKACKKCLDTYDKLSAKQNELIVKHETEISHLQREIEKMRANPIDFLNEADEDVLFANAVFPIQA